jgi:hypothetical protein
MRTIALLCLLAGPLAASAQLDPHRVYRVCHFAERGLACARVEATMTPAEPFAPLCMPQLPRCGVYDVATGARLEHLVCADGSPVPTLPIPSAVLHELGHGPAMLH